MDLSKPVPNPTPTSQPYWDALAAGDVKLQQCDDCGSWVFYPRSHCSHCLSPILTWKTVSGEGELYSFTIARSPTAPQFAGEEPQYIAVIELNEGIRLNSVLTEVNEADIKVGMKVVPAFHREGDATLLYFKPAP